MTPKPLLYPNTYKAVVYDSKQGLKLSYMEGTFAQCIKHLLGYYRLKSHETLPIKILVSGKGCTTTMIFRESELEKPPPRKDQYSHLEDIDMLAIRDTDDNTDAMNLLNTMFSELRNA